MTVVETARANATLSGSGSTSGHGVDGGIRIVHQATVQNRDDQKGDRRGDTGTGAEVAETIRAVGLTHHTVKMETGVRTNVEYLGI